MVFTRKRQAEDDAAQMDMIDAACSAAGPSGMSLPAAVTDNAVATSTEGISQSAPVRGQSTLNGKWPVRKRTKVKVESDDQGHAADVKPPSRKAKKIKVESDDDEYVSNVAEPSIRKSNSKPIAMRRRSNKIVPAYQNTGEDEDYNPAAAPIGSDGRQLPIRFLRKRGPGPVVRTYGVITLKVTPQKMAKAVRRIQKRSEAAKRRMQKKALAAAGLEVPPTNKYNFTFGVSQLEYHLYPRQSDIVQVAKILEQERPSLLAQANQDNASTPMHSGRQFTIDAIVRVMLSQASTNEGALDAQQCMIHAYPYIVDGQKVIGTIPNYHLMRVQSQTKLDKVLKRGGLNAIKAEAIKAYLDAIYKINLSLLGPGEVTYRYNPPDASDFVPGMLSVDYLRSMYALSGKQAVFDHLVSFNLIGVKSAACIMAFGMDLPVFAVDTHVAGMAKLLGWVPQDAKEEDMCSHLDAKIRDDIKFDLHQDFWRHRRACARCGRNSPGSWAYENTTCPLEDLITRPKPKEFISTADIKVQPTGDVQPPSNAQMSTKVQTTSKVKAPKKVKAPSKSQTRPRMIKQEDEDALKAREDALRAQGKIKVTYRVDDDFDAASSVFTMRTVWINDFSLVEADIELVPVEEEPVEGIEVCKHGGFRIIELRDN